MSEISDNGTGERGNFVFNPESNKYVRELPKKPVEVNAPYVKKDEIVGGIESWVDGKVYDSKSRLRRSYKENNVVEKGNERLPRRKQQTDSERRDDIHQDTVKAFYDLKYDRVKITELEKEKCQRELRHLKMEKERRRTRWAR